MFRIICAVTSASLMAGICTLAAEPSRMVETGTQPTMMADRSTSVSSNRTTRSRPYYERGCLRDRRHTAGHAPAVRLVSPDRLLPTTSAARIAR
jgi:hypothetical protein